ncbi:trypsin-like peptidase domain-containing protein [Agaribacterium haliotis]|uniref:trypsin-like peptidase domain-containing protein n=1 Tax=Agaribacterium haliotis TaxID=2013869 RepID=UPI001304325A|nr:trypsin-like peptidase domain-containing protein [Agaribacterium haliotis]
MAESCLDANGQWRHALVKLNMSPGVHASGVVIAKDRVLTVAHALAQGARLYLDSGEVSRLIAVHEGLDLALLHINTGSRPSLPFSASLPKPGQPLYAYGWSSAHVPELNKGKLLEVRWSGLYSSAAIAAGSSGGALLSCEAGQVSLLGLLRAYRAYFNNGFAHNSGVSIAVEATQLKAFIAQYGHPAQQQMLATY